jgi:hypothetical protein
MERSKSSKDEISLIEKGISILTNQDISFKVGLKGGGGCMQGACAEL